MYRLNLFGKAYFDYYEKYLKSNIATACQTSRVKLLLQPKVGDTIHLHNMGGSYKIHMIIGDEYIITCNKWQVEHKRGQREFAFQRTRMLNFKCFQGLPFSKQKQHVAN
jgi:hypothetical protein